MLRDAMATMIDQPLIDRADQLITKGESVLQTAAPTQSRQRNRGFVSEITSQSPTNYGQWSGWRSQALSFLRRTFGENDTYAVHFDERCVNNSVSNTEAGLGVLRAVREDLAQGNLARLPETVRANLFSDFLEMAEHLLSTGYKDAAAVLAGGVLEEHIRLLCTKHGVPIQQGSNPKKAGTLNAELAKAGIYNLNRQQMITSWQAPRNSAAHGQYDEYESGDIQRFIEGLRDFIDRYPA